MGVIRALITMVLVASAPSAAQTTATGSAPIVARDSTPDLSGTWVLDTERSWLAEPDRRALSPDTLIVRQTATTLTYDGDPGGDRPESIVLGGRTTARHEGGLREVASTWKDGWLIVTTGESRAAALRYAVLAWMLNADGDELTLVGTSSVRDVSRPDRVVTSEVTTHRVYRKKP